MRELGLGLGLYPMQGSRAITAALQAMLNNPAVSSPGKAGSKNGSVTWSGGVCDVGPCVNPWTGALAGTNKLTYTQDFANAVWTKTNVTLTPQTAETMAPDGTQTATKVLATATAVASLAQSIVATATAQTASVFVKRGSGDNDANRFRFYNNTGVATLLLFAVNFSTGVVTYSIGTAGAYAIDCGNGWWRIVCTVTSGIAIGNTISLRPCFTAESETANEYAYVWGAQLEAGNVATDYYPNLGTVAGMPIYVRRAMPGFTVPRVPLVLTNAFVNSQWAGASAGVAPTGWAFSVAAGDGAMPTVAANSFGGLDLSFTGSAGGRKAIAQAYSLPATGERCFSCTVVAAGGGAVFNLIFSNGSALPAGASSVAYANGVAVNASTYVPVAGDRLEHRIRTTGTAGTQTFRFGVGCSAALAASASVTLRAPQDSETPFTTYLPTTTVARCALDAPFRHDFRIGQNMLVQSSNLSVSPWTLLRSSSVAALKAGAYKIAGTVSGGADNSHGIYQSATTVVGQSYSVSAWVKAGEKTIAAFRLTDSGDHTVYFNLVAGTVGTKAAGITSATITASEDGWLIQCVRVAATTSITASLLIADADNDLAWVGDDVSGIYACCPQVESGVLRSTYTPTTTAAISAPVCEPVRESEQGIYVAWHAQGARTNLCPIPTGAGSSLSAAYRTGIAFTMVESALNAAHFHIANITSPADGVTHHLSFLVRRTAGARNASIYIGNGGSTVKVEVNVNLSSGAITTGVSGGVTVQNAIAIERSSGLWRVDADISCPAWGAGIIILRGLALAATYSTAYQGDGVSGITFEAVTLEAASFSGIPLGEGVARTADNIVHNLATPLSTVAGEIVAVATPYAWSAGAGAANPTGATMRVFHSAVINSIYRHSGGFDTAGITDAGGFQSAALSALSQASGLSRLFSLLYNTAVRFYRGSVLSASDITGITPPWVATVAISIASEGAANHWFGTSSPFLKDGGFTDGERALLANALDGKAQAVLA